MDTLLRTPLYRVHKDLNGRIVSFAGWEMPVQYSGVINEHRSVRERAGLFDVSHMGEIEVSGPKALDFCQLISTNDASKLQVGQVQYSCYCMPHGGVVDDFTLFRTAEDKFLFIVNASNKDKDFKWMTDNNKIGADIKDLSDRYSLLALQGPLSESVLSKIFKDDLGAIKFYWFVNTSFKGSPVMLSRTGYTGEDGFEIMIENSNAVALWEAIMDAGKDCAIVPVGLGARDTLRMEMGYALYGHELNEKISPLEANLGWIVKLAKEDFVGKKTLVSQKSTGFKKRFTGFKLIEKGVPRENYLIYRDEENVGWVTSGTFSPSLSIGLGLCYVNKDIKDGETVEIEIRNRRLKAVLEKPPFVKGSIKR